MQIEVVVLAIPASTRRCSEHVAIRAAAAGASVRYLPSFVAALERTVAGRPTCAGWTSAVCSAVTRSTSSAPPRAPTITDRVVLVTGAGGSIGSASCAARSRRSGRAALIMLDHDESNLHRLQLELRGRGLLDNDDCRASPTSATANASTSMFAEIRPDVVFHAAAHKHLPLLEAHPGEAREVERAAAPQNVARGRGREPASTRFVLISTDKAANPIIVLGATKRLAEAAVQAKPAARHHRARALRQRPRQPRLACSPSFAEQIERATPVTVTHPDVTRYFMTIEEAVRLVVQAARSASDGETFVLDMGEPVRILDVARRFAEPHAGRRRSSSPDCARARSCTRRCSASTSIRCPPSTRGSTGPPATSTSAGSIGSCAACTTPPPATTPLPFARFLRRILPDYHPNTPPVPVQFGAALPR